MSRPFTSAEAENRAAFLVQLKALLTQLKCIIDGTSAGNKAKLEEIHMEVQQWLAAIGEIGTPRPSIVGTSLSAQDGSSAADAGDPTAGPNAETPAIATPPSIGLSADGVAAISKASSAITAGPGTTGDWLEQTHSFTADPLVDQSASTVASACQFGGLYIMQLVDLLRMLFAAGIPESARLRVLGRGLARLLTVRCASTITAALQHVVFQTYSAASRLEYFVFLSKDISLSTKALTVCLSLVTFNADLADAGAIRFPLQLCVTTLKQMRRTMLLFQSQLSKAERALLRQRLLGSSPGDDQGATAPAALPASEEADGGFDAERLADYAQARAHALEELWGPSLARSLADIGEMIQPTVSFLVKVASLKEGGAAPELVSLKAEAQNDLFALCEVPSAGGAASSHAGSKVAERLSEAGPSADELDRKVGEGSPSPGEKSLSLQYVSPVAVAGIRATAVAVLKQLGISYGAHYLVAVASWCGDENGGSLIATRIVSDELRHLATTDPRAFKGIIANARWRKPLLGGILNCLVSVLPAVLASGLEDLHLIVTVCYDVIGQEVGFLYCGCVLRLLESDSCPTYVKKEIVLHLVSTLLKVPNGGAGQRGVPLLLRMYRTYDLDVHAHQLNLIQQLVAALSKIVRRAAPGDFTPSQHPAFKETAAAASSEPSPASAYDNDDGSDEPRDLTLPELLAQGLSLPSLALHGLVLTIELLSVQSLFADETEKSLTHDITPLINRSRKLEEQRLVDLFNGSPKKGIVRIFGVTDAEMNPPGCSPEFLKSWELEKLPPPATEETRQRVEAVVDFFTSVNSLSPDAVSEYMATPAVFPLQVCLAYMRRLRLAGCGVVEALQELLSMVPLPKEGQRIERLLEYFSGAYFEANERPGVDREVFPFKQPDSCFIGVVATVMLNTGLHNPLAGSHMNKESFRMQIKASDPTIRHQFADNIFFLISRNSLNSAKGLSSLQGPAAVDTHGGFETLFISGEERRQLAFALERQKLVSDTRQLLQCRNNGKPVSPDASDTWWWAATRDLFQSTWASVCAVFGPTMCEGLAAPVEVIQQCIRGLQALMYTASSFALYTECEVTLLALLRLCKDERVREMSRMAILIVASSAYSCNFSSRCWMLIFTLMSAIRQEGCGGAMLSQVESVVARLETFTRASCEAVVGTAGSGTPDDTTAADSSLQVTERILGGISEMLKGLAESDGLGLSTGLYFLRRSLEYSVITHSRTGSQVSNHINVRDFSRLVLPLLTSLVTKHRNSDEVLQVLMEFAVDALGAMWNSYTIAVKVDSSTASPEPGWASSDTPPPEFVDCYNFFKLCYMTNPQATLVKMHLLQGVMELMARTLRHVETAGATERCSSGGSRTALYMALSMWRRVLYPLARALSDPDTAHTEVSSLAVLVLRKLVVVVCTSSGGSSVHAVPAPMRAAVVVLLASVAYAGGMCGDIDCAQACLGQLTTLCSTAISQEEDSALLGRPAPQAVATAGMESSDSGAVLSRSQPDKLMHYLIEHMTQQPQFLVAHTLERLCLLLRCERDLTRAEAVASLRTLSLQLQPAQVPTLTALLSGVLLEGTVRRPTVHGEVPLSDPSLISYWLLLMDVPLTMKRCSRSAFRSTLQPVLGFMTNELLSVATGAQLGQVAQLIMERCLVPIIASPHCSVFQTRSVAARAFTQCATFCLSRQSDFRGGDGGSATMASAVLRCLAMILYTIRVPSTGLVPQDAAHIGKQWGKPECVGAGEAVARYRDGAEAAVAALAASDPHTIIGSARTSLCVASIAATTAKGPQCHGNSPRIPEHSNCSTFATRDSTSARSTNSGHTAPAASAASGTVTDDQLVEYCNFLAQIVSGLPKTLSASAACPPESELQREGDASLLPSSSQASGWTPPPTSPEAVVWLLLEAARTLFAALWRINHPIEMDAFAAQHLSNGHEMSGANKSAAVLPHAAIRGTLNSYMELTLRCEHYPIEYVLPVVLDVSDGVCAIQGSTQQAGTPKGGSAFTDAGTEAAALQRLSPQAQQHIRSCNSGMLQELSVVLAYWVRCFVQPNHSLTVERQNQLEEMAMDPRLFTALVHLLSPSAGSLIVTARDYFAWFIVRKQLHHSHGTSESLSHSSQGRRTPIDSASTLAPGPSPRVQGPAVENKGATATLQDNNDMPTLDKNGCPEVAAAVESVEL